MNPRTLLRASGPLVGASAILALAACGSGGSTDVAQQNAAPAVVVTPDPTAVPTPVLSDCPYAIQLPNSSLRSNIVYHLVGETCAQYDSGLASGTRGKNLTSLSMSSTTTSRR